MESGEVNFDVFLFELMNFLCADEENAMDDGFGFSNSLFMTGSGRKVTISPNGIVRAKNLLGLGFNDEILGSDDVQTPLNAKKFNGFDEQFPHLKVTDSCKKSSSVSFQSPFVSRLRRNGFEGKIVQPDSGSGAKQAPVKFQSVVSNIQTPQNAKKFNVFDEESPYLQRMDSCKTTSAVSFQSPLVGRLKNGFESTSVQPDSGLGGGAKQSPIKFQTAGGRSLSISSDALKRARSLLGDPDLGDFFDGGDSLFSFPDKRQTNTITSSVERSESTNTHTPLLHQMTPESNHNHMKKSFTYPLEPFKQMEFSNKLPHEGNGNNLIMKFDDAVNESDCGRKSSNTPGQKPLYNKNDVVNSTTKRSSLNGFSSRMDSRGKPLGRALVNISNTTTAVDTNNKQPSIRKRRVGLSATVSSFKKPRISNISASGDQGVQNFRNGKHDLGFFLVHSFHIY
jgi:hypothetical protein